MTFLLALLVSFPLALLAWRRTGAYASVTAQGGGWGRMAAVRAGLAALAFACCAQGAWFAWQDRGEDGQGQAPATIFLVDDSSSMLVADAPGGASRLNYALSLARDWAEKHPGAPVGLVAFGASPRTVTPRTSSDGALAAGSAQVRADAPSAGPAFLPAGVAEASRRAGKGGRVVLLSDGGDPEDGAVFPDAAKAALEKAGASLSVAVVGTQEGGKIRLRTDAFGENQYKKFGGQDVVAKATPKRLKDFARAAGGSWLDAEDVPSLPAPGAASSPSGTPWAASGAVLAALAVALPAPRRKKTSV